MRTTLERPKTLAPKAPAMPKPVTDFSERCDNGKRFCWLGISRLTRVPDAGFPSRKSCQEHVTDAECLLGVDFVRRYREAEELEAANNIPAVTAKVKQLEDAGGFEQSMQAQKLREQLRGMDDKKLVSAMEEIRRLRGEAIFLCVPILERLLDVFDEELNETAIAREEQLISMGVSLFSDHLNDKGERVRKWELHSDSICTALQCRREVIRHSLINLSVENSVGCVQYLMTAEERVPWQWLA